MSAPEPNGKEEPRQHPPLLRDARGRIDVDSVPDVIQWFLDYDSRVAIIKHPRVEEVFQWKQEQSRQTRRRNLRLQSSRRSSGDWNHPGPCREHHRTRASRLDWPTSKRA